jgi:UDPglucose--hexose-1-phosphate uridylyltransferase
MSQSEVTKNTLLEQPHRRWNPLRREWVLVSPHRNQRPWQGQIETSVVTTLEFDPECYLCPGNRRANGEVNPKYEDTFTFDNEFASLSSATAQFSADETSSELLRVEGESGICRVLCFSPRHDLTLPLMTNEAIVRVVDAWSALYQSLGALDGVRYVQIFENKGSMMGCSNPHPHGQVWGTSSIPDEPGREHRSLTEYLRKHDRCLICDYLQLELARGERMVCSNDFFTAVVPFWAVWPFETLLLSRRHFGSLAEMNDAERAGLADIIKHLTTRYDNLFEVSFPYSMGFHQSPTDGHAHPEQHFHGHFYPPLLRSATIRKFMVGFELLGTPQRDLTPESAAFRLRELSDTHFRLR